MARAQANLECEITRLICRAQRSGWKFRAIRDGAGEVAGSAPEWSVSGS